MPNKLHVFVVSCVANWYFRAYFVPQDVRPNQKKKTKKEQLRNKLNKKNKTSSNANCTWIVFVVLHNGQPLMDGTGLFRSGFQITFSSKKEEQYFCIVSDCIRNWLSVVVLISNMNNKYKTNEDASYWSISPRHFLGKGPIHMKFGQNLGKSPSYNSVIVPLGAFALGVGATSSRVSEFWRSK